jgi:hypothetical protein
MLPDGHAAEMGAIGVGIPDALDDRKSPILEQFGGRFQGRMQPNGIRQFQDILLGNTELATALRIVFVSERNHCVEAIISAIELDDDENPIVLFAFSGLKRVRKNCGNPG